MQMFQVLQLVKFVLLRRVKDIGLLTCKFLVNLKLSELFVKFTFQRIMSENKDIITLQVRG